MRITHQRPSRAVSSSAVSSDKKNRIPTSFRVLFSSSAVQIDPPAGWVTSDVAAAPVPAREGGLTAVVVGFPASAAAADAQASENEGAAAAAFLALSRDRTVLFRCACEPADQAAAASACPAAEAKRGKRVIAPSVSS